MRVQNAGTKYSRAASAIGWRMLTVDVTNEFMRLRTTRVVRILYSNRKSRCIAKLHGGCNKNSEQEWNNGVYQTSSKKIVL